MLVCGEMPGSDEVCAGVGAAAGAVEEEGRGAESGLDGVFVVGADVGCACRGKGGA